jgi:hypothetical protein
VSSPALATKVVAIHDSLETAHLAHAFGGALALAYYVLDVRATKDIDVNIFVAPDEVEEVFAALPTGVARDAANLDAVRREGQARLWWDETPVDLFFDVDELHRQAAAHIRTVPFADTHIPILGSTELTVFKMLFARPKDWLDIAEMLRAGVIDVTAVSETFARLPGADDESLQHFHELVRE